MSKDHGGYGKGFALIVVLFLLLIIVGAGAYGGGGCYPQQVGGAGYNPYC